MKRLIFLALLALIVPFSAGAKNMGPDVSKYSDQDELKWEDGAYGYHVMFKSLIDNKKPDDAANCNPQGDTCKDSSTYNLSYQHIPSDAIVERAFLVWTGAIAVAKKDQPTDNEVQLAFQSEDGKISKSWTVKAKKAYKVSEAAAGKAKFGFDAFKDTDNPQKSWFTYRVDITDDLKEIQDTARKNAAEGTIVRDGDSLFGSYTVSGLECAEDGIYQEFTELVSDWSIILIYSSIEISPKKIYIYDGFRAYWYEYAEIKVQGFTFPTDPEIRITLASHEGDPGLYTLNPEDHQLVPEGIQVRGKGSDWLLLSNKCNPAAFAEENFQRLDYTEIFNSISSVYGYNEAGEPQCIGGIPTKDAAGNCSGLNFDEIEYGMDMDTFVIDSSKDSAYASQFNKGGKDITLRVGANKDSAITNYMIVSVDTKAPQFDIPGLPEKVACTPAGATNPYSFDGKWCQNGLEHTFALRIQNWGTDEATNLTIIDNIPEGMEYVPGSTEYATSFNVVDDKKIATRWIPIPDSNGFPLKDGFKLKDPLKNCDENASYLTCDDLVVVRFRAKAKGDTPKNQIIENTATYKAAGNSSYRTNLGIPVKLRLASAECVNSQDAVDLSECGGVGAAACTKNEDCPEGYVCENETGACIEDPAIVKCQNSEITASVGKNNRGSKDGKILISNPQEKLVVGQLELSGKGGEECYFTLDQIKLKVDINANNSNISLSGFKMYNDVNGNGSADPEDTLLASADEAADGEVLFPASKGGRLWNNKKNNILFVLDAKFKEGAEITNNAFFGTSVNEGGILISDGGEPKVEGKFPIEFGEFQFEPNNGLIVTKGPHDPEVPAKSEMNRFRDVLQLRVMAKGSADTLKKITVKTVGSNVVSFGSGVTRLAIYEDNNNDGQGDTELASTTEFKATGSQDFSFEFELPENQDKYLTVKAELNLSEGESFQIKVEKPKGENFTEAVGVPVFSQIYEYSCNPDVEDCGGDSGCSITSSEENSPKAVFAAVAALFALISALAFRMRKN